jgi:transcription elongation factor GreB
MSRAFVKEDVDPPERSGRARTPSGLPPGAANYLTARGAKRLRRKLEELCKEPAKHHRRIAELEQLLASATIVDAPEDRQQIAFGARVTVRDAFGQLRAYQVVGVDELDLHEHAVSWISPAGKALLAAEIGHRVAFESGERLEVVAVEYPGQ